MVKELKCCKCKKYYLKDKFFKDRSSTRGYSYHCKVCKKQLTQAWYLRNPDYKSSYMDKHPGYHRRWHLKTRYNLTEEQVQKLIDSQNGYCAICVENLIPRKTHIDHCHKTGKIRGILCSHCNTGMGLFKENINSLSRAIKYLSRSK